MDQMISVCEFFYFSIKFLFFHSMHCKTLSNYKFFLYSTIALKCNRFFFCCGTFDWRDYLISFGLSFISFILFLLFLPFIFFVLFVLSFLSILFYFLSVLFILPILIIPIKGLAIASPK